VINSSYFQVRFNTTVKANGFYITTSGGPPAKDVAEICFYGGTLDGAAMRNICKKNLGVPISRGADYYYDRSLPKQFGLFSTTTSIIFAAGFLISAWLGSTGSESNVRFVLVTMFLLSAMVHFLSGLGLLLTEEISFTYYWLITPQVWHK